jgi:hypothetical protein
MFVVPECPAIQPGLRWRYIVFKWPQHGWCVARIIKASAVLERDSFNVTVKYPDDDMRHRHRLEKCDEKGVVRYRPDGTGLASSWVLLQEREVLEEAHEIEERSAAPMSDDDGDAEADDAADVEAADADADSGVRGDE